MKKLFSIFFVILLTGILSGCVAPPENECTPIKDLFKIDGLGAEVKMIGIPTGQKDANGDPIRKGIITWIYQQISSVMEQSSEDVYEIIAENEQYQRLVGLTITLTIMFYSLSIMLGLAQANGYHALTFIIKISIVYALVTDWGIFYFYVGETFEALVNSMTDYAADTFSDFDQVASTANSITLGQDNTVFGNIDKMISALWNFDMIKAILAFGFSGGFAGPFYALMMFALLLLYLFSILTAVKTFLLALIGRFILYALAPLFLIFALFNQTKSLFDNWLRQLISFVLQTLFLIVFLSMLHMLLSGMIQKIYMGNLDASMPDGLDESCVTMASPDGAPDENLKFFKLCRKYENTDKGVYCEEMTIKPDIPVDIWMIISCLIICYLMFSMVNWIVSVANNLAGGVITVSDTRVPGFDRVQTSVKGGIQGFGRQLFQNRGKPG